MGTFRTSPRNQPVRLHYYLMNILSRDVVVVAVISHSPSLARSRSSSARKGKAIVGFEFYIVLNYESHSPSVMNAHF